MEPARGPVLSHGDESRGKGVGWKKMLAVPGAGGEGAVGVEPWPRAAGRSRGRGGGATSARPGELLRGPSSSLQSVVCRDAAEGAGRGPDCPQCCLSSQARGPCPHASSVQGPCVKMASAGRWLSGVWGDRRQGPNHQPAGPWACVRVETDRSLVIAVRSQPRGGRRASRAHAAARLRPDGRRRASPASLGRWRGGWGQSSSQLGSCGRRPESVWLLLRLPST